MNIVLTGFMASGKTEISKAISSMSQYTLLDTDDLIAQKAGMTINEIFAMHGEKHFRMLEKEVVKEVSALDNTVIATGGGIVLDKENITLLRQNGIIFYLSPDFSVIKERVEEARKTRPLLQNESISDIQKRFNARLPLYADCDYKIKIISGRTPKSYAMEILKIAEANTK